MLNSLYVSASGMLAEIRRQDITANNLANASTNGYKRDIPVNSQFPLILDAQFSTDDPVGSTRVAPIVGSATTDFSMGSLRQTSNRLDMALAGNGFFAVQTPQGVRFTRNGNFHADAQGMLVNARGDRVLGANGQPINVGTGNVNIDAYGTITGPGGATLGQIAVVAFENAPELVKMGDGLFAAPVGMQAAIVEPGQVRQGYLEASNVNPIREMVNMIEIQRTFEANQRVIRTVDQTLDKAVNQVGRI